MGEIVGTGRHLSRVELRLWTSFLDTSRILESELDSQLRNDFGMSHREYEILVRVDGGGGRMRMSQLARQIEALPSLVTLTVSRLVDRGWIERQPSAIDRRGVEATLTSEGRSALANAAEAHADRIRKLLIDPLQPQDVESISVSLGLAADHLRNHRAGRPCADPDCPVE